MLLGRGLMRSVTAAPNLSEVVARILSGEAAQDGWGAWAEVEVEKAATPPGIPNWAAPLIGSRIRVFVPPPLVEAVLGHERFEGGLTFRSSPAGGMYALIARKS